MLEEWGNELQKRRDAEQRLKQEEAERSRGNSAKAFQPLLNKYLNAAKNGDENARMILALRFSYYRGYNIDENVLPQWAEWIKTAAVNKNLDAMNYIGFDGLYTYPGTPFPSSIDQGLTTLEEAANLGSLDAMVVLGDYYNRKPKLKGGGDANKAKYWFSKAADGGSPNAMYIMGLIYKNGIYNISSVTNWYVKYKIVESNRDSIAFNWFLKSLLSSGYQETLFSEFMRSTEIRSYYNTKGYAILKSMYDNEIGCKKSEELRIQIEQFGTLIKD